MTIEYSEICEQGFRPEENQDSVFCASDDGVGLFVVADGMGGHFGGSAASGMVVKLLGEWWKKYISATVSLTGDYSDTGYSGIKEVLSSANDLIRNANPGVVTGSTAVVLYLEDNRYSVLSCGDSRCYRVTRKLFGTEEICITTDDVWENDPLIRNSKSEDEIRNHRNFGKLIRAVGTERDFSCTGVSGELNENCLFMLCSDGVYKYADEKKVSGVLRKALDKSSDLDFCLGKLKEYVYQAGAPDNFSAVLVRVLPQ